MFTDNVTSYKPSVYYFRRALRATEEPERLREIGLTVVAELEQLKSWIRDQGMVPPKWRADPDEASAKGWKRG